MGVQKSYLRGNYNHFYRPSHFFKSLLVGELEQLKLELEQRVSEMDQNLNEQGASFRAQVVSDSSIAS